MIQTMLGVISGIIVTILGFAIKRTYEQKGTLSTLATSKKHMSQRLDRMDDDLDGINDDYVAETICDARYSELSEKIDHLTMLIENIYEDNGHGDPDKVKGKKEKQ